MKILKVANIIATYKKSIIKVWMFGFLSDIIGCIPLIFMGFSEFGEGIYIFDYKIALKNTELSESQKKKTAVLMAIFTAPYLFFMPAIGGTAIRMIM